MLFGRLEQQIGGLAEWFIAPVRYTGKPLKASEVQILYPPQIINNYSMTEQTIESKVASTILEKPISEIEIDGVSYKIAPPSIGTIILISEIISQFPVVGNVPKDQKLNSVLHYAKDFKKLAELAAVLILGAKGLTENRMKEVKYVRRRFFGLMKFTETKMVEEVIDRKKELAEAISKNIGPRELYDTIVNRLSELEVDYFFAITTSLSEVNIIKPTREVG